MVKSRSKYKYIRCNPYKRGVAIFIGDCESLKKWARRFYSETENSDLIDMLNKYCTDERYNATSVCASTYYSEVTGHHLIHIPSFSFKYNIDEISNLSHEILHAAMGILDFVGVEYVRKGDNEAFTYLFEYILKEALIEKDYKKV